MKTLKLTRHEVINLCNVHFSIKEPEEDKYSAEFKIRLNKNKKILREEFLDITDVLNEKLNPIKEKRDLAFKKNWVVDRKGKFIVAKEKTSFFHCIFWPEYKLKKNITLTKHQKSVNDFLNLPENKKIMGELRDMMKNTVEIELYPYPSNICPDTLINEFYKELDILTEVV
jgi:hypothetical protein